MNNNEYTYLHMLLNDLRELQAIRAYNMTSYHKQRYLFLMGVHLYKLTGNSTEALKEVMHLNDLYNEPLGHRVMAVIYDYIATMSQKELQEFNIDVNRISDLLQVTEEEKSSLSILAGDTWTFDAQRLMDILDDMPEATKEQQARELDIDVPTLQRWKERLEEEQSHMLASLFMQAI